MEPATKPKNWLLIKIRQWHSWLGVLLAGLILLVCLSGIYLNHKDLFTPKPKEEARAAAPLKQTKEGKKSPESAKTQSGALATTTDLSSLAVTFEQAMAQSHRHLGDTPIEKIELRQEKGTLIYKIKAADEREVVIDAASGKLSAKDKYRKAEAGAFASAGTDWGKLIKDLHTGKIGGLAGKLVVDFTSLTLIVLTLSGIYLFAVPRLRKRKAAREAAIVAAAGTPGQIKRRPPRLAALPQEC